MYVVLYLANAMAPEASPDGATYHLGLVSRYLGAHGFVRITDNMYAAMPGGVEMLFLFAFAFGKHSAAALVHFAFLVALAWQIFSYARWRGFPVAGASAALLVFASPVVGIDGTSAYNDVAVAAIAFTLFYLLQIWDEERNPRLLAAIGLAAGFAFATKYTAWPAVAYAVGFVLVKNRKAALPVAACAAAVIAPWLLKNWIYLQNPVAPFFNRQFPNPYVMAGFEDSYRRLMAMYQLKSRWEIPMEATVYGSLSGLLGPVFLLAPLGLLALRRREGRQLWLAALVFGVNYFSNIATRFLIPPLPFVALAMTLGLSAMLPQLAVAAAMVSAVLSWPSMIPRYSHADAWRLLKIPWRDALRLRPEEGYLETHLTYYGVDRMIERATAPGSTVFTFVPVPEAYTSRHIRVAYQSAANQIAGKILLTAVAPEYAPTWRLRFRFPRQTLRGVRVVQTNRGEDTWSIHEFRIYRWRPRIDACGGVAPDGPTVPVGHTGRLRQLAGHLLAVRRDVEARAERPGGFPRRADRRFGGARGGAQSICRAAQTGRPGCRGTLATAGRGAHGGRRSAPARSAPRGGGRTQAAGHRLPAGFRYRQWRRRPARQRGPVGNPRGGRL